VKKQMLKKMIQLKMTTQVILVMMCLLTRLT
jgi:hypothetical protein